jgi:hypothetical protein
MPRVLRWVIATAAILLAAASVQAQTTFSCPMDPGSAGDLTDRGFYVTNYNGSTLKTVTVQAWAGTAGSYTVAIVAHSGTYDGPVIGSASTTVTLPGSSPSITPIAYNFGTVPVVAGSTVAFVQSVTSGPGTSVFVNTGLAPCSDVTETEGTAAPLDTFRRNTYGVLITGDPPTIRAVPALSTGTLAVLALLLGVGATLGVRRRRS